MIERKKHKNNLIFLIHRKSYLTAIFDIAIERTWWRLLCTWWCLFQKNIMCTKLYIYIFIV